MRSGVFSWLNMFKNCEPTRQQINNPSLSDSLLQQQDQQKYIAARLREKYPDKVPVLVTTQLPISKKKFLISTNETFGRMVSAIRDQMQSPDRRVSVMIDEITPPETVLMSALYEKYGGSDGYLRITVF